MKQYESGYARIENDVYETPSWVTDLLVPHIPGGIRQIWEPACASGKIVRALQAHGYEVIGSEIRDVPGSIQYDFFNDTPPDFFINRFVMGIITNPPYKRGVPQKFIERSLGIAEASGGFVAMLLDVKYDCRRSRRHLFADNPYYSKKIILHERILWIEGTDGDPKGDHAWYIWDFRNNSEPTIHYA
jgi:hypothetical protein